MDEYDIEPGDVSESQTEYRREIDTQASELDGTVEPPEFSPTFLYELDDLVADFNGDKYYIIGRICAEDFCGGMPVYELEMMNARNTVSWVFPEYRIAEKVDISKFE